MKNRKLLTLLGAGAISEVGDWLSFLALNVLLYASTHSGFAVSGLFIAKTLPSLAIGPFAGILVDRHSRKMALVGADLLRGLVILSVPFILALHYSTFINLIYFYLVIGVNSTLALFFQPAKMAFIPEIKECSSGLSSCSTLQCRHRSRSW